MAAPEDISALASYLRELGYEVEYAVARGQAKLRPADLEVDVEPCAAGEALSRASRMAAGIGGDVFLAPGALSVVLEDIRSAALPFSPDVANKQPLPETAGEPHLVVSESASPSAADLSSPSEIAQGPRPVATELSYRAAMEPETEAEYEASIPYGSIYGGLNPTGEPSATAAVPLVAEEPGVQRSAQTGRPSRLTLLTKSAAEARGSVAESLRHSSAAIADGITQMRARWRIRQNEKRQFGAQRAAARHAARESRAMQKEAQAQLAAAPARVQQQQAPAPMAASQRVPRVAAALRRISAIPRQATGRVPRRWMMLGLSAAAAACLIFAWAALVQPDSPLPPGNANIEQQLPFGPVRITPRPPAPSPSFSSNPAAMPAPTPPSVPQKPAPSAVRPKAAGSRHAHRASPRRSGRSGTVADDDVTVRHFDGQKPARNPVVSHNGAKRITDLQ